MSFIDDLREELIESGEASKVFLDYIDHRIQDAISNRLCEGFADVESNLLEVIKHELSKS